MSVQEFMSIPELQQNPLVQRVIDIFDTDGNGEIDFKGKQKFEFFQRLINSKFQNLLVEYHNSALKEIKNPNFDVS